MAPRPPSSRLVIKPPRVVPPPNLPSSYSFVLDLPPPISPFPYKQLRKERPPSVVDWSLRSKVATAPVRRCLITQQLRHTDLMIQFKAARPASSFDNPLNAASASQSNEASRRYFVPTNLLHPRFSVTKDGRGAWITCWRTAVQMAALKGSYKRLSPSLTMPSRTIDQITSQLALRISQEVTMFCERMKSRQPFVDEERTTLAPPPIVNYTTEEVGRFQWEGLKAFERDLMRLVAVVSFESNNPESPFSSLLPPASVDRTPTSPSNLETDPSSPSLPADLTNDAIPFYHLSNLFSSIVLPPSTRTLDLPPPVTSPTSSKVDSPPESDGGVRLLNEIRGELDKTIKLFAKRIRPPSTIAVDPPTAPSGVYGIYSTISTKTIGDQTAAPSDAIPLLLALRRVRMWTGEGWTEAEQKTMIVEAKLGKKKL